MVVSTSSVRVELTPMLGAPPAQTVMGPGPQGPKPNFVMTLAGRGVGGQGECHLFRPSAGQPAEF